MQLSKNDANLLTREGVFIFISKKLGEIDSEIENEMLVALRRRISEQRHGVANEVFIELAPPYPVSITMMNFVIPTKQQLSPKPRRNCNIYILYNHRPTPTHQQPTHQQPTHLQHNFALLQLTI
jgi:hypothetical protein